MEDIRESSSCDDIIIIGAGPAGLTAALEAVRSGLRVTVLEADPVRVGGISRTVEHAGYGFDIGGHRFFSKSAEVNRIWRDLLPDDLVERPRLSRIFYKGRFYSYPLEPLQALRNLGPVETARCMASFAAARLRRGGEPRSFEDWVVRAFGRRLFEIFFRTYSEKVWGMPCSAISADWAAQRIKGLDLGKAVADAMGRALGRRRTAEGPKTLITSFLYPRRGPGQMWAAAAARIDGAAGSRVLLGRSVASLDWDGSAWTVRADGPGGAEAFRARNVVSTASVADLAAMLPADARLRGAAAGLRYRDYVLVAVVVDRPDLMPDNWIYVHDPDVRTGRIQNFGSWSPDLLADPATSCLGFEYFCDEGDSTWAASDGELVDLAFEDLGKLGFARGCKALTTAVVRQRKAYPVYDDAYRANVAVVRERVEALYPTLHLAGRNGMHRYNNQDHAMMTGLVAARNVAAGKRALDPWRVNDDAEYIEDGPEPAPTYSAPAVAAVA